MHRIRRLDTITINKIAAGEVIERPLSVIKELLENSLDAKATRIKILLEQGGIDKIDVIDNGVGIYRDDLEMALSAHATSKIDCFDDLYGVVSFGFRGEALASMVHIADVTLCSKQKFETKAFQIEAKPGDIGKPQKASLSEGTHITVKNLFRYVPVRKKQLKRPTTELAHCVSYIQQLSFWYPQVDFECIADNQLVYSSVGLKNQQDICASIVGIEHIKHFIAIEHDGSDYGLQGIASSPLISFPTKKHQMFAVNGRPCDHAVFRTAIQQVYGHLIPAKRHPLCFLNLIAPKDQVDVNIHPKKQEVLLFNQAMAYKTVPFKLRQSLQKVQVNKNNLLENQAESGFYQEKSPVVEHATRLSFDHVNKFSKQDVGSPNLFNHQAVQKQDIQFNASLNTQQPVSIDPDQSQPNLLKQAECFEAPSNILDELPSFFQLFHTYLAIGLPSGLWLLDQHAVHEKILYEKLKSSQFTSDQQRCLMSQVISLTPTQYLTFEDYSEQFKSLGFGIQALPAKQVSIEYVPVIFSECNLELWLTTCLDQLEETQSEKIEGPCLKETLQMRACKAAIKAGKKLSKPEVLQLINDFLSCPSRFTCPHGRPLYRHFNKADLEKIFLRS